MNTVVLLFPVILLTAAFGQVLHENHDKSTIPDLHLIGAADGVGYFYENITFRTWFNAGKYCQSHGMQLASINTENQLDMLNSTEFPQTCYWTAGRDAEEIRQFTWNDTLAAPDLLKDFYSPWTPYRSCLYVYKYEKTLGAYSYSCDGAACYTLCSTECDKYC